MTDFIFLSSKITTNGDCSHEIRTCLLFGRKSMTNLVCVCVSHSVVSDSAIPWTVALQPSLSMEFSKQEYWSGLSLPSPGDLPNLGIELKSSTLQADSLLSEPPGKPYDKPRQCIKEQRHHFANKDPYSQSYGLSSSHVQI